MRVTNRRANWSWRRRTVALTIDSLICGGVLYLAAYLVAKGF